MNLNVSLQTPSTPPLSPLGFRLQKSQSQSPVSKSPSSLILKRKRPLRIEIPAAPAIVPVGEKIDAAERVDEVEIEGEEYAVYCKRGRRGQMEDRYSAVVGLEGDSKQVCYRYIYLYVYVYVLNCSISLICLCRNVNFF